MSLASEERDEEIREVREADEHRFDHSIDDKSKVGQVREWPRWANHGEELEN